MIEVASAHAYRVTEATPDVVMIEVASAHAYRVTEATPDVVMIEVAVKSFVLVPHSLPLIK
jgi:hypothetical protein